jgi:biotin operon repressor
MYISESDNQKRFEVRDLRRKEKFFVDDLYLNGYAKKCGIYATGVYLSLCRHANKEQKCYPSQSKMGEELHISTKQVSRSIKKLEELNIIKKIRVGKKLNNRYLLLDKSEWTDSPITKDYQSGHIGTASPIHSNDTHISDTQKKEVFSYKKKRPFYNGDPMRWVNSRQKWYVIVNGEWLEYVGKKSEIEWK